MSADADKSWPNIPPSQLKLSRAGTAESDPAEERPSAASPSAGLSPASTPAPPPRRARSLTTRDWVIRGGMIALLVVSLGVLVWSYGRLAPVQAEGRQLSERVNKLEEQIAQMERGYSDADLEALAREFRFAGNQLYGGEEALAAWFNGLKRAAVPLALEADADFGQPQIPATNYTVAVVPATLTLNLKPSEDVASAQSPHVRVLTLLETLVRQTNRADLVALHVVAGTNSIAQVKAEMELWAGKGDEP